MVRDPDNEHISSVLCAHPRHRAAFSNKMVVCFFWQMIISYQTEFCVTGRFQFRNRGDAALMKWLYERVSSQCRLDDAAFAGVMHDRVMPASSSEDTCLEIAAMAQAVKIANMCPPVDVSDEPGGSSAVVDPLARLRDGVNLILQRYQTSGPILSDDLVQEFVRMMMWWESDEGLEGLRFLIRALDGEGSD
jgi:hypothetical protein